MGKEVIDCLFCGAEATWRIDHGEDNDGDGSLKGWITFVCTTCKEAYEAGQASSGAEIYSMDDDSKEGKGEE